MGYSRAVKFVNKVLSHDVLSPVNVSGDIGLNDQKTGIGLIRSNTVFNRW